MDVRALGSLTRRKEGRHQGVEVPLLAAPCNALGLISQMNHQRVAVGKPGEKAEADQQGRCAGSEGQGEEAVGAPP